MGQVYPVSEHLFELAVHHHVGNAVFDWVRAPTLGTHELRALYFELGMIDWANKQRQQLGIDDLTCVGHGSAPFTNPQQAMDWRPA